MKRFPARVVIVRFMVACLLLPLLVSGCRSVRRGEPIQGALDVSDPRIARGQQVYARNCAMCHPGGEGGLGPALNQMPFPRWLMKVQVRTGLGVMPDFDQHTVSSEDLDALVNYSLAIRRHHPHPPRPAGARRALLSSTDVPHQEKL